MNKTAFIVLIAILASGCICYPNDQTGQNETSETRPTTTTRAPSTIDLTGEAQDLWNILDSSQPYVCNFTNGRSRCQIWLSDGKYHATIYEPAHAIQHIMCDQAWTYIWTDDKTLGTKYQISEVQKIAGKISPEETAANKTKTIDLTIIKIANEAGRIDCKPTDIEPNLFTPPANRRYTTVKAHLTDESEE